MTRARGSGRRPDAQVWNRLTSFTEGLYEELDKLAKKAPSSPLSDLATQRVNRAIRDAKELMASYDPYIAELAEFVPAGENPEVRDAVLVLKEIRQALERLNQAYGLWSEARGL